MSLTGSLVLAAEAPGAGGAPVDQIAIATAGAVLTTAFLVVFGIGHRTGRTQLLARLGAYSERVSGLPAWAAIPNAVTIGAGLLALFGFMWDVSIHIAEGRDEGPLANPAHYFILAGLYGFLVAGVLGLVLPKDKPSASSIRLGPGWYAPLGAVLTCAGASFSLAGFPLDDVWHRIYGQDVTLWGPTHLMLLGGAVLSVLGQVVTTVEAMRPRPETGEVPKTAPYVRLARLSLLPGGALAALSIFQAEFDFGVPQYRLVFGPLLVVMSAAIALTMARVCLGKGAALAALLFYLPVRAVITWLVGPVLDEPAPAFPLYVVEALVVEAIALRVDPRDTVRFGALCGAAIGTVGLASEWLWTEGVFRVSWGSELFPEGVLFALPAAIAAGLVGAWMGGHLMPGAPLRTPALRRAGLAGGLVLVAVIAAGLVTPPGERVRATVALTEVTPAPERTVRAEVRIEPREAAEGAELLNVTSWQGGGFRAEDLEEVAPGVWRTPIAVPVHGTWKTVVRLQDGASLKAVPIFLPADEAIPVPEVPAAARFTRDFQEDHLILQREQKDVAGWLYNAGLAVVAAIAFTLIALFAWGFHRLAVAAEAPPARRRATA